MESKLIPAQTGNGTMKMYTNCRINLSVDNWPPKRKDIQLLPYYLVKSCMSGGQLSTDKLVLQFLYFFTVSFPVIKNDANKYAIRNDVINKKINK